jgi:hypothetical protein
MNSSKRFVTVLLAAGVVVLLVAILVGERMGDRVMVEAADTDTLGQTPLITPVPSPTTGPYGPDWKRTHTPQAVTDLSAAFAHPRRVAEVDAESQYSDLGSDPATERKPAGATNAAQSLAHPESGSL